MFYTGASSWLKTPLLGTCTSRRQRMTQIHSASQICWKCWEEWIIVPANRKHHLASLSWKKVCMKIPYCKLWLLWQDAMLIPMAELEQICAERNPEVTKSGERYWVYLIDRELNLLLQFGKEMSMTGDSWGTGGVNTVHLPSFGPQEGNVELQLKQTGLAKTGVQFNGLRINDVKQTS